MIVHLFDGISQRLLPPATNIWVSLLFHAFEQWTNNNRVYFESISIRWLSPFQQCMQQSSSIHRTKIMLRESRWTLYVHAETKRDRTSTFIFPFTVQELSYDIDTNGEINWLFLFIVEHYWWKDKIRSKSIFEWSMGREYDRVILQYMRICAYDCFNLYFLNRINLTLKYDEKPKNLEILS